MKFDFIFKDFSVWKNKPNKCSTIFSSKGDTEVLSLDKIMRLHFRHAACEYLDSKSCH